LDALLAPSIAPPSAPRPRFPSACTHPSCLPLACQAGS
jgi:hypothetical protein